MLSQAKKISVLLDYGGEIARGDAIERFRYAKREAAKINMIAQLDTPIRLPAHIPALRNLYDTYLKGEAWKRINDESLDALKEGSKIVYLVHGLTQTRNSLLYAAKYLRENGFLVSLLGWNDRAPIDETIDETSSEIERTSARLGSGIKQYAFAHSSGGDILRYAHNKGRIQNIRKFVLAAPTTNGCEARFKTDFLFKDCPFYTQLIIDEKNAEIIGRLQQPSHKYIVLSGLRDFFVPLESALDLQGQNIVLNCGHMALSGAEPQISGLVSCLFELEPKDILG